LLAILFALIAATGFAFNSLFARLGSQGSGPRAGAAISLVPSFILAATPALILHRATYFEIPLTAFLWIAIMGILQFPLGRLFNYTAISKIGATRASPLFTTQTLFGSTLAIIFLGERPNMAIILGTIAVVLGVILIVTDRGKGVVTNQKD
jgi:drug/metabolite transporter (DMT)-like permease